MWVCHGASWLICEESECLQKRPDLSTQRWTRHSLDSCTPLKRRGNMDYLRIAWWAHPSFSPSLFSKDTFILLVQHFAVSDHWPTFSLWSKEVCLCLKSPCKHLLFLANHWTEVHFSAHTHTPGGHYYDPGGIACCVNQTKIRALTRHTPRKCPLNASDDALM